MAFISAKNLVYKIKKRNENNEITGTQTILDNINIDIEEGEFVAVVGRNGSGKSTFARHLNALLYPEEGTLYIDGNDTSDMDKLWEIRKACGMVFQNPDNQIVGVTLEEDVAFGLENLEVDSERMNQIVAESLERVGLSDYKTRTTNELSGGQKQRLSISSVLAMKPKCMVFDEVTSMLDPKGRKDVLNIIKELNRNERITVVYITHDMNEIVDADRIYLIDDGVCRFQGTTSELFQEVELVQQSGLKLPTVTELSYQLYHRGCMPRYNIVDKNEFVAEYISYNQERVKESTEFSGKRASVDEHNRQLVMELEHLTYAYQEGEAEAVKDVSLSIYENEFVGIVGHTGSGKSTLMQLLDGLYKKTGGRITFRGQDIDAPDFSKKDYHFQVGLVFQYPESQLFEYTVLADVMYGPMNMGLTKMEAEKTARTVLQKLGMKEEDYEKSPFHMSGGEKRKVAIAGVFAMNPDVIILDEPTAGLDAISRDRLFEILHRFHKEDRKTIIVVSHSMEDIAKYTDRVVVMNHGKKVLDANTRDAFLDTEVIYQAGLDIPEICKIMNLISDEGITLNQSVLTVEEAVQVLDVRKQEKKN